MDLPESIGSIGKSTARAQRGWLTLLEWRHPKGSLQTVHGSHTPQVRAVRAWGHGDFTTSPKIRLRNPADQYFVMFQIQASFLLFFYSFFSYAWHFFYFLLCFSLWIQLKALFFQAMVSKLILIILVTKFKINQVSVNFLLTFSIKKPAFDGGRSARNLNFKFRGLHCF